MEDEVLDNVAVHYTENNELTTHESVEIEMTELPVENIDTKEEMAFDDLTIPGDYSDYDILEEEQETTSLDYTVWVKTKK